MNSLILYSKKTCPLCDEVRDLVSLFHVELKEVNIEDDPYLHQKYMFEIPVLKIGNEELDYRQINYFELEKRLQ